jgi:glucose/arabinose dehydrogenase
MKRLAAILALALPLAAAAQSYSSDEHTFRVVKVVEGLDHPWSIAFLPDGRMRNMQGAALHPVTGLLWTHEHGPQGGDEINISRPGVNYGWPVITYGVNYGIGTRIGEGSHKEGMAQPLYYWVPSIAPSGMAFYTGDRFPKWKGDLFVGALKDQMLVRLKLDGEKVVREERMLKGVLGRIRDVRMGPDGFLYVATDEGPGVIARLEP